MYSGKIAVPPGGGGIQNSNYIYNLKISGTFNKILSFLQIIDNFLLLNFSLIKNKMLLHLIAGVLTCQSSQDL
jgi:hypothetical protein